MSSYAELQRLRGTEDSFRIYLPDTVMRDIAFRRDGGWIAALHIALASHCPRGGERFVEALDAGRDPAAVLFEMPALAEGDPPIHVIRWTDEAVPAMKDPSASMPRARWPKPPIR